MKLSEIPLAVVKDYCGISDGDSDNILEKAVMPSAKAFIRGYTGLSDDEIDKHEDITTAFLVLVYDMYTQRDYILSYQKQVNPCVETILNMYAKYFI